ncbi:MAG TPA: SDR family NAD(P)-dependent oxidoreductase [Ktedonobacteraceae bacterium]|nr:SDR family NAD(P)-dependent oxidoreductase [Ktedonobacteraceae bacterium]
MVVDGWSMGILTQELGELYQAFTEKRPSPLPPLPIQYKDYAAWQREWLQGEVLSAHMACWQEQLRGVSTILDLPTDRARPPRQTFRGAWHTFSLPDSLVADLKRLSRHAEVTLFMTLLAAFEILLARYTGQEDFVIGTPVAGRDRPELEGLIGLFINTLVLRANLSNAPSFLTLLKRVRATTLEAYTHQELPFEQLVESLRPTRDLSRNPLVQVLFRVHNTPRALLKLPGIETTLVETEDTTSKFDLSLVFLETPEEGWSGSFEYNTDLFNTETIARMAEHMQNLLEGIVAHPEKKVDDLLPADAPAHPRQANRTVRIGGLSIALNAVEQALLRRTALHACRVLARKNQDGEQELVAYVVTKGHMSPELWQDQLRASLPEEWLPRAYLPISHVPLTPTGEVDDHALLEMAPVTAHALARWEEHLRKQEGIEQVAVVMQERIQVQKVLHLADLLPDRVEQHVPEEQLITQEKPAQTETSAAGTTRATAWSDGGPLSLPASAPQTLTEALLQTARVQSDKGILVVQADGSEVFLSYPALLEKAGRVMTGLYKHGLQPGDRAILQVETLQDHFIAFWGCVLGGIRPVTVAIAPTYTMVNAVTSKLRNTWELLEHPIVLTNTALVEPLAGLETLCDMQGLHILSVDELKMCSPAEQFYASQPQDVTFYQLTSGSTGIPKCIQETHRAIIAHIHGSAQFNGYTSDDVTLNWLPMDHVVPILTFHLKDVYLGCQQIHVKTDYILAQPLRWLDLLEARHVTHSWSPNFGFKLVADQLATHPGKTWDLSAMQFLMNAGEQVTLPVVRDFLERTAPFGIRQQVMQPAFGMAEVCTCMTYQNTFTTSTGIYRVLKSSLQGALQLAGENTDETAAVTFVDLGAPMPGVQIRITDAENKVLPEGTIGQFQIKGTVLMPGYLYNETANRESFVGDGWFNSGDLGFILNGRLTLTGRAKEMIIIRGANFYCYEIEDVVNAIEDVEPTFVGTCAVEDASTGTEGLAIFFVPRASATVNLAELIRTIHRNVTTQLGIAPRYIIPLTREQFPKTTSGKIQRSQLKKSLAAGEYQELLKHVDLLLENANTLPDWFYRTCWQPRSIHQQRPHAADGAVLVLLDREGVGTAVCELLRQEQQRCIVVESGISFERLGHDHYQITPGHEPDYRLLSAALLAERIAIKYVVHLWGYHAGRAESPQGTHIKEERSRSLLSILFLLQALEHQWERGEGASQSGTLLVVSNQALAVRYDEEIAYEKGPVLGLLKTISQELPWLHCIHLDILEEDAEQNALHILYDLYNNQEDQEVAYREGQRFVARLEHIDWSQESMQPLPLLKHGFYLLSGGLGGVGYELARHLLQEYQARLLLSGRTPIVPSQEATSADAVPETPAARLAALQALAQHGGAVRYEQVDVCDLVGLQRVVSTVQQQWGMELDGIFHLAGSFVERALRSEQPQQFEQTLLPKMEGTWNLHQLLKDRPGSLFVSFSSVNAFFGGSNVAAYASANSFLAGFAHYQRVRCGLRSYCIAWSMWDEMGISRGYQFKGFAQARGYQTITAQQGWYSLLSILHHAPASLLVGLNGHNPYIRPHLGGTAHALLEATAYLTPGSWQNREQGWPSAWGPLPGNYRLAPQVTLPLNEAGEIDRECLGGTSHKLEPAARQEPRNQLEQQILEVWQQVLHNPRVGVLDNFFALGGHSLLATQVVARLQRILQVDVSVRNLFETPTVASLAERLLQQEITNTDSELLDQLLAELEE